MDGPLGASKYLLILFFKQASTFLCKYMFGITLTIPQNHSCRGNNA